MKVYHLGNTKFARALNGEGAKLHGGRWNKIGTPCIYTSESIALCVLEYSANVKLDELPDALSITIYELPEDNIRVIERNKLPKNWREVPAPEETKIFGSTLLQNQSILAIKIPSIIIPTEFNFILNPLAENFKSIKIIAVEPFSLDKRIKS